MPDPGPVPVPPSSRQAGQKAGEERFGLRPGGVPIPDGPHTGIVLAGVAGAGLAWWLADLVVGPPGISRSGGESKDLRIYALFGGGFAVYKGLRHLYEASMLQEGAGLRVSAEGVTLPGVLGGRSGDWRIPRAEIEKVWLGTEKQKYKGEVVVSVNLGLKGMRRPLTVMGSALDADLEKVGRSLEAYLLRPLGKQAHEMHLPVPIIVGFFALAALGFLFVFFG